MTRIVERVPVRLLAGMLAPAIGAACLALTSCGSAESSECLKQVQTSSTYDGSPIHRGMLVTVPRLGKGAIGLDVGFETPSGTWEDSELIPPSFLEPNGDTTRKVVVGVKGGVVRFRFAEIVPSSTTTLPAWGAVRFGKQTTEQMQPWQAVSAKGIQPAWPQTVATIPACAA